MKTTLIAVLTAFALTSAFATEVPQKVPKVKRPIVVNIKADLPSPVKDPAPPQNQIQQMVGEPKATATATSEGAKASAPSIYAVASNPSPTTCDGAGVSIGGTGTKGGGLLNFGIGERESCLGAQDANSMSNAGFSQEDIQRRLCQVSTISKAAKRCQQFASEDQNASSARSAQVVTASEPTDPYVRQRMGLAPL